MSRFDFYIHVIDDRPGLNTIEQNTFAHEKHLIKSYEEVDLVIPSGHDVFVVVMTLGYRSDLIALLKLIEKSFAYIGMLGSENKVNTLMKELANAGYSKKDLKHIHAPIGIKIDSHTPEEIAVSIAAELIQVRNVIKPVLKK
jgi:xanthine dehydrogenase accessory factor